MEPINWLAVIVSAGLAAAIAGVPRRGQTRRPRPASLFGTAAVMLIASAMLGHNFSRIGAVTLAAKPWLYVMQSCGIALAFVIPALWLTQSRAGADPYRRLIDASRWLAAYLAIGATFWVLDSFRF